MLYLERALCPYPCYKWQQTSEQARSQQLRLLLPIPLGTNSLRRVPAVSILCSAQPRPTPAPLGPPPRQLPCLVIFGSRHPHKTKIIMLHGREELLQYGGVLYVHRRQAESKLTHKLREWLRKQKLGSDQTDELRDSANASSFQVLQKDCRSQCHTIKGVFLKSAS